MARPKGTTSDVQKARKILKKADQLKDKVHDDVFKAYDTILEVMQDKDAVAATRRAAAMDIIAFFNKVHEDADLRIQQYEASHRDDPEEEESDDEVNPDEDDNDNILEFAGYTKK